MDLHYSQTIINTKERKKLFHYLMDLHYSQTELSKTRCWP